MTVRLTEGELADLGERLGASLKPGTVVWLSGELGAGKTTLARAVARGLGVREPASSPTYGLVHHYAGARGPVYHVDCYRLRHPEEAAAIDWDTITASEALLIEWPERAGGWAPAPTLRIHLAHTPREDEREMSIG